MTSRARSIPAPFRMQLMVLIGFLALIGAMAMLINGSSLRTGFATSGSIGLPDTSSSDSVVGLGHITTGINATTNYDSTVLQHASVEGPDRTRLVPKEWIHQGNPIYSDVSVYWGGKWAHVTSGPHKTVYFDLDDWAHITIGPRATDFDNVSVHIDSGPDKTGYDPTQGGRLVHVTAPPTPSLHVPFFQHIKDGENATGFAVDGPESTAHITQGTNKSIWVLPARHKATGEDKTSLISSGPLPESRPAPAPIQ